LTIGKGYKISRPKVQELLSLSACAKGNEWNEEKKRGGKKVVHWSLSLENGFLSLLS
jgi:hypothetical protein